LDSSQGWPALAELTQFLDIGEFDVDTLSLLSMSVLHFQLTRQPHWR
jgi:hypothetical protein